MQTSFGKSINQNDSCLVLEIGFMQQQYGKFFASNKEQEQRRLKSISVTRQSFPTQ